MSARASRRVVPSIAVGMIVPAVFLGAAAAQDVPRSRIAILGKPDIAMVGQDGYCGSMVSFDPEEAMNVLVEGGKPTWVRTGRHVYGTKCVGDFSFIPEPGKAYIVRFTDRAGYCVFEVFRVHPGQTPTPVDIAREDKRSCLLPWNHRR